MMLRKYVELALSVSLAFPVLLELCFATFLWIEENVLILVFCFKELRLVTETTVFSHEHTLYF